MADTSRSQPGLPLAGLAVPIDDATGRVEYREGFLPAELAQRSFEALRVAVRWEAGQREMYGRRVQVPRLTASYRLDDPHLPPAIAAIRARLAEADAAPFNAVGLNLYRDQHDSVAPHNDHLYEIVEGQPIALVSLGAARTLVIATKRAPRRSLRLDLQPGSLLTMSWLTQLHYDHGVPKQRTPVGPRISLAFRVRLLGRARAGY